MGTVHGLTGYSVAKPEAAQKVNFSGFSGYSGYSGFSGFSGYSESFGSGFSSFSALGFSGPQDGFYGEYSTTVGTATRIVKLTATNPVIISFSGARYAYDKQDHYLPSGVVGEFEVSPSQSLMICSADGAEGVLYISEMSI